jgi:hypothetical protein
MALKLPHFIKIPEHNRFDYKPIYYDKRKEELETKINRFKEIKELSDKHEFKPEIKGKFRTHTKLITKKQKQAANLRLAVIIIFTAIIMYLIIQKADIINKMLNVLISG